MIFQNPEGKVRGPSRLAREFYRMKLKFVIRAYWANYTRATIKILYKDWHCSVLLPIKWPKHVFFCFFVFFFVAEKRDARTL